MKDVQKIENIIHETVMNIIFLLINLNFDLIDVYNKWDNFKDNN